MRRDGTNFNEAGRDEFEEVADGDRERADHDARAPLGEGEWSRLHQRPPELYNKDLKSDYDAEYELCDY